MADNVDVYLKVKDPNLGITNWFVIDEPKTVGLAPDTTFFEYTWTPNIIGVYEFYAYVDRVDEILEWDDSNNEYDTDKYIEVFEKLPDLQVVSMSMAPVNEDGYAMVGVSSEVTATIANLGVRNMTASEATKLEVSFYTSAPFASQLATINVNQALAVGLSLIHISEPTRPY